MFVYFSDPHRYSAISKKKTEERRDSPIGRPPAPIVHPSPPKERPHDLGTKNKPVVSSPHKVLRRTSSKESEDRKSLNSPLGNVPGTILSHGTSGRKHMRHSIFCYTNQMMQNTR